MSEPLALPCPVLGQTATLHVARLRPQGAYLAWGAEPPTESSPAVLLPRSEVPEGLAPGQPLSVFVYLDSEDRLVATTRAPALTLGDLAFLRVVDLQPIGAFFDWGLPKHLFVPHAEQTRPLQRGDRHPIALYVDPTGRLAGTMRVSERLRARPRSTLAVGEWVEGEAWRRDHELGLFVIAERRWVGRVPAFEPQRLARGERAKFRVAAMLPDGKVELSLRATGGEQRDRDQDELLARLRTPGATRVREDASPEEIRERFGMSKKAFKRAIGGLLRRGEVELDDRGDVILADRANAGAKHGSGGSTPPPEA